MLLQAIKKNIVDWLTSAYNTSGTPIIEMYQNAPAPTVSYFGFYIRPFVPINDDFFPMTTNDGVINIKNTQELTVDVNFIGPNPSDAVRKVVNTLSTKTTQLFFRSKDMIYVTRGNIDDVSTVIDGRYEKRAICKLRFRINETITENVGYFDHVDIEGAEAIDVDGEVKPINDVTIQVVN